MLSRTFAANCVKPYRDYGALNYLLYLSNILIVMSMITPGVGSLDLLLSEANACHETLNV